MADQKDCHTGGAEHRDQKGSAKADGKHGHKNSKKLMHRMAKSLNLTDVQEGAIKELMQVIFREIKGSCLCHTNPTKSTHFQFSQLVNLPLARQ